MANDKGQSRESRSAKKTTSARPADQGKAAAPKPPPVAETNSGTAPPTRAQPPRVAETNTRTTDGKPLAKGDPPKVAETNTQAVTTNTEGSTTNTDDGDPSRATTPTGQPAVTAGPVTASGKDSKKAARGRVSAVTLQQGVMHRQRAAGVAELQEALGLAPTGYPDDALSSSIAAYRKDHGLGEGSQVDVTLLQHLGFDVVTV